MKQELINIENLDANKLPELQGMKDSQLKLVEENPFIEIIDNKTYEVAKQRRTALLKGRTSLEAQDKLIASKLTNFRKQVSSVTAELIEISKPHEEKQQEEVKRYEAVKEAEKAEKERLERERIEGIKNKISELENNAYLRIKKLSVEVLESNLQIDYMATDFDFEEFDILFEQAKLRVNTAYNEKIKDIQEKENQRLENERLAREKEEAEAKQKELEAQLAKERQEREAKEKEIQEQQEKERKEREAKEREEKEKVFEIRKNRLAEIGFRYNEELQKFILDNEHVTISKLKNTIYSADIFDFENIILEAKEEIQKGKERKELIEAEKQARQKAEAEARAKAEKENKERIKRLSKDKKIIADGFESFFGYLHLDTDNEETKDFIESANKRIQNLKSELINELDKL